MTETTIDLDAEIQRYTELSAAIDELTSERAVILERLRTLPVGKHATTFGVGVTVSAPARSFNLTRAWAALTPQQQALCVSPDAKKVKDQLPGVLVEAFMEDGTGVAKVAIK